MVEKFNVKTDGDKSDKHLTEKEKSQKTYLVKTNGWVNKINK